MSMPATGILVLGVLSPRPAAPEGSQRQPGGLEVAEWAVLIIKEPRLKYASTGHT